MNQDFKLVADNVILNIEAQNVKSWRLDSVAKRQNKLCDQLKINNTIHLIGVLEDLQHI